MTHLNKRCKLLVILVLSSALTACVTTGSSSSRSASLNMDYSARLPPTIASNEKTIVIDPRMHVWGAYENGQLINSGIASAGADWCRDIGEPCRTNTGSHRIQSLGGPECVSRQFPVGRGGAPMPYCMFFSGGQALHGVPSYEVGEGNYSHGCVRMQVGDAEWVRYNFADVGTRVIVNSY